MLQAIFAILKPVYEVVIILNGNGATYLKMSGPPFKSKFSLSCPVATEQLRWKIENDVDYTQTEKGKPICLKKFNLYSICLPPLNAFPPEFKHWYNICVLDLDMKDDLQRAKVINWCRTAKPLYPVKTTADGNCLLHAVSLALWGIEDDNQFLRRLVYIALAQDVSSCFQKRWLLQLRQFNQERPRGFNFQIDSMDWKREWESVINAASDLQASGPGLQYTMLESIHLYVVANILKRPIIVLGDNKARTIHGQSIQENNLLGIYLPLEWSHSDVSRCPIIIGYSFNHFTPLVSQENTPDGRAIDGEYVVPLILSDQTQIPLKFLLANEEPLAHELLRQYLKIQTVPLTLEESILEVPAAKVEHLTIHDADNLVASHRIDCERIYRQWVQTEFGQSSATSVTHPAAVKNEQVLPQAVKARTESPNVFNQNEAVVQDFQFWPNAKCITNGCEMFGSPVTANMCSKCFEEYTVKFHREERARKGQEAVNFSVGPSAPPASMPVQESGRFLSLMGELCHNKCGLRCSTQTFPLCHECAATRTGPVQNLLRQGDNLQRVEEIPLTAQGQGQIKSCKIDLCVNPATEGCDNYCRQCYDRIDERLFGEGEENLNSLLPQCMTPKKQANQSTSRDNFNNEFSDICTSPNCKEKAVRGKCARCIIKSGSTDSLLNSGSSPTSETYLMQVSTAPTQPTATQHPSDVHVPQHLSGVPQALVISQGATIPQASAGTQTLSQINSPSPPEAYQYYKCKNKFCNNFADQSTLSSYCRYCVEAKHGASFQQQSHMASQNSTAGKHLCPTPGCEGIRLTNSPYCLKCTQSFGNVAAAAETGVSQESQPLESGTPSSAYAMAVETANPVITSSKQKVNCASPLCKTLIYPPKRLCDNCTEILRQNHARNALAAGSEEEQRSRSLEMLRESPDYAMTGYFIK
ncbi:hypothetical protein KUTeg_007446 [Tegillarca granosa]|uniref:ubiquitinyl hydrolase 1 n=1 Tax=Tegillarca granosa TaxID=220873 RepID=A0ABQ9FGL6_TEGGR|nr:hypothetical protein KUTeg_007446 [Tegillarca granosa]